MIMCFGCFDLKLTSKIDSPAYTYYYKFHLKIYLFNIYWFVIRPLKSHLPESFLQILNITSQKFEFQKNKKEDLFDYLHLFKKDEVTV